MADQVTFASAISSGRLAESIAQEEAREIGPMERAELDALTAALITSP